MIGFGGQLVNRPYTISEARKAKDLFAGSPREERNLNYFVQECEGRVQGHLDDAVRRAEAMRDETAASIENSARDLIKQAKDATIALRRGEITPKEGRKRLAKTDAERRMLVARLDALQNSDDALAAMATKPIEEYEAEFLERTPALRLRLPILTADYLNRDR